MLTSAKYTGLKDCPSIFIVKPFYVGHLDYRISQWISRAPYYEIFVKITSILYNVFW